MCGVAALLLFPGQRCTFAVVMISSNIISKNELRSESDKRAFREAHWLLVAFGISAVPATLLLCLMGGDFIEGDFGMAGTVAGALAGGASIACIVISGKARRLWADGRPLADVLAVMYWPLLLLLVGLFLSLLVFATEFSFLMDAQ